MIELSKKTSRVASATVAVSIFVFCAQLGVFKKIEALGFALEASEDPEKFSILMGGMTLVLALLTLVNVLLVFWDYISQTIRDKEGVAHDVEFSDIDFSDGSDKQPKPGEKAFGLSVFFSRAFFLLFCVGPPILGILTTTRYSDFMVTFLQNITT